MPQIKHLNLGQKKWVQINDDSRGTYNTNSQIKFKISMLKSSLCDYSDAYMDSFFFLTVPNFKIEKVKNH